MQSKRWVIRGVVVSVVAVGLIWGVVRRHLPPYEEGVHTSTVEAQTNRVNVDKPHIDNCPVFPADNVWNMPVDKLPKNAKSDEYIQSIGPATKLHPDFGTSPENGIPYTELPAGTKSQHVTFDYHDESDLGDYTIPTNAPIEGGASSTGDRHVIVIDQRRCLLLELWSSYPNPDGSWKVGSGIKMDLTSNALREDGKTSADAAGLPIFPGLVRYDEVAAGEINHAIRFTIPHTQAAYIWPARHKASSIKDPNVPPMGLRLRLRADFDISGFPRQDQVILKALKRYGMLLADNGGGIFLSGVPDKRWSNTDLHRLGEVTGQDFEAVDEGMWPMIPNSARVDPLELKPE